MSPRRRHAENRYYEWMNTIRTLIFLAASMLSVSVALAQEIEPGSLLVSRPALDDPTFSETVLLLLDHGNDGSLAIALNRPTWVEPADAFPEIDALQSFTGTLFFGGPASPTQLLILFESDRPGRQNSQAIFGSIRATSDLNLLREFNLAAPDAPRLRLYAGFAAWAPGQLASEIAAGNWRLLPASADHVFTEDPESLCRRLPSDDGGVTAMLRRGPQSFSIE